MCMLDVCSRLMCSMRLLWWRRSWYFTIALPSIFMLLLEVPLWCNANDAHSVFHSVHYHSALHCIARPLVLISPSINYVCAPYFRLFSPEIWRASNRFWLIKCFWFIKCANWFEEKMLSELESSEFWFEHSIRKYGGLKRLKRLVIWLAVKYIDEDICRITAAKKLMTRCKHSAKPLRFM